MLQEKAIEAARDLQLSRCTREHPVYFHGKTMLPFLQEADELDIQPVDWRDIRSGDIVTYRYLDRYPTHRVIRVGWEKELLVIKGDAWPQWKRKIVSRTDVLGRAVARRRAGQWVDTTSREWRMARRRALIREGLWIVRTRGWHIPAAIVRRVRAAGRRGCA